ncbi:MAG: DUF366 family protein [Bdellovibrionaceae bacterium]|nr:DUF366 family protein [Pseudobdellovibrionaceae bacterium]
MQSLFIEKKMTYDGQQLKSLHAYLTYGVLGNSIISWVGPCNISFEHMVDGEDLIAGAKIEGAEMLHFIIEIFDRDLFSGVALQRLFTSMIRDYLQVAAAGALGSEALERDGDDIFWDTRKLNISIAAKSPVSTMIHWAVNCTNRGTPVATCSLEDLKLQPAKFATEVMVLFKREFEQIVKATQKVRPLS